MFNISYHEDLPTKKRLLMIQLVFLVIQISYMIETT